MEFSMYDRLTWISPVMCCQICCLVLFFTLFLQVAMGQGQADLAIQMLKECARSGDWLCLKNLHLVVSWLPVLEKVDTDKCGKSGILW